MPDDQKEQTARMFFTRLLNNPGEREKFLQRWQETVDTDARARHAKELLENDVWPLDGHTCLASIRFPIV
jgi:hypothetical protein